MYKLKLFFTVFISLLFLIACENEPKPENLQPEDSLDQSQSINLNTDETTIQDLNNIDEHEIFEEGTFKSEYLELFLPEKLNNLKSIPHTTGRINDGYRIIRTVTAQYINSDDSNNPKVITISIKDYGPDGIGGERKYYTIIPEDDYYKYKEIESSNMKGYLQWPVDNNYHTLKVLVEDRYLITIEGDVNKNDPGLTEYLSKIPIQKLIEIGNKSES